MAPVRRPVKKCPHGRRRTQCCDCGGSSVCEHGRQRRRCCECGGVSVCVRGRRRAECCDCGGASVCEHGRQRHQCRSCGGASVCEHGRQRNHCRDCGGASICEHGRRQAECCDCGGASVCEHGRLRRRCRDCGNFVCEIQGCPRQDLPFFADFALPAPWGYVLLEVDEKQHKAYDPILRRAQGLRHGRQRGARQRPQAAGAALQPGRLQERRHERHAQLIRLLGELLAREPEVPFTRLFLFYDRDAENSVLPVLPVRAVSRCA